MKFFRPRETPVENLTFLAMMVAFDAIISIIAALLPLSALFVMLLAPFTSAVVSLFCKKRYIPLYLFAAIGICIGVTAWDFLNTLFYMIPSLVAGMVYGLLWRAKVPATLNIFGVALVSLIFFYLSLILIKALLDRDMVQVLLTFIGRGGDEVAAIVFPMFVFGYSVAQTALMHAFMVFELRRLGFEENDESIMKRWYPWLAFAFLVASFILAFFFAKTAYFLFGLGIYWAVCSFVSLFPKVHPILIVTMVLIAFGAVLLFAGLHSRMPPNTSLLLFALPLALLSLVAFFNPLLLRLSQKDEHRRD